MVEMVLYVIFVSLRGVMKKGLGGKCVGEKELRKVTETISTPVIGSLLFFDDYFKGVGYGSGRADSFTLGAPPGALATLLRVDKSCHIIN